MGYFICIVHLDGEPIAREHLRPLTERLASRGLDGAPSWEILGSFAARVQGNGSSGARLARSGSLIGVGDVRLDNPEEVAGWRPDTPAPSEHLELALGSVEAYGIDRAAKLLGDFSFVTWDPNARRLIVARDALGVKALYYSRPAPKVIAFASHASLLGNANELDEGYLAKHFLRMTTDETTVFGSVDIVPAAHTLVVTDGKWSLNQYWSPDRFDLDFTGSRSEATETFRHHFAESVRLRLASEGPVWSELSGGLDTSAVVSMASRLYETGAAGQSISGTLTYADSLGAGNESEFVDAVVQSTGVRNEQVQDSWPWKDDGSQPLFTESPGPTTFFWSRNRWRDQVLADSGAKVLLSGHGGDHLLEGNLLFFADRLAAGSILGTCVEIAHWAAVQQHSFWRFAYSVGIFPLLPNAIRSRFLSRNRNLGIPNWVDQGFRKRTDMDTQFQHVSRPNLPEGPLPRYRAQEIATIRSLSRSTSRSDPSVGYERRYPFLYRPLVELTLQFAPRLKILPKAHKVTLREALRGVLPETIRTRLGKGGVDSRMLWALNHESRLIQRMLRDPILAQMGYVDAGNLRDAYDEARAGKQQLTVPLYRTLALETWLLIEHGRWPRLAGAHL